jgi:hypothetical protein
MENLTERDEMKNATDLFNASSQKLIVELKSVENPDYYEDPSKSLDGCDSDKIVEVCSFRMASKVCRIFITDNNLGSGNWAGGKIFLNDEQIAHVSYNGRVWDTTQDKINYWKDSNNEIT